MTDDFGFWSCAEEGGITGTTGGEDVKVSTTLEDEKSLSGDLVIKPETGLLEKLKGLKSHRMQVLFMTALVLSCISFTATPAIFYLLCKVFTGK